MVFIYNIKWRQKLLDEWHRGGYQSFQYIAPGEKFAEKEKWIERICIEPIAIIFKVYPLVRFDITDLTKAIEYATEEGLTEETAELIRAAKELEITKEPETLRL